MRKTLSKVTNAQKNEAFNSEAPTNAALIVARLSPFSEGKELTPGVLSVSSAIKAGQEDSVAYSEKTLIAQAEALDTVFCKLTLLCDANMNKNFNASEKLMRLALKAQSQCRATLQTLSDIKNPRPYIQNNSAHYQQVNNGEAPPARENLNFSNELNNGL